MDLDEMLRVNRCRPTD